GVSRRKIFCGGRGPSRTSRYSVNPQRIENQDLPLEIRRSPSEINSFRRTIFSSKQQERLTRASHLIQRAKTESGQRKIRGAAQHFRKAARDFQMPHGIFGSNSGFANRARHLPEAAFLLEKPCSILGK